MKREWKVYDIHTHPYLMEDVCKTEEQLKLAVEITGLYKTGVFSMRENFNRLNCAGVDVSVLSPLDLTTARGTCLVTNEETKMLEEKYPERFLGFASVDPRREDAVRVLERAFGELELNGLYLFPSLQKFYPNEPYMKDIYDMCVRYNKPILFDCGMSPYPGLLTKYQHPLLFEEAALSYPALRICLTRFGWPWVREVCMLMLKYRNVYTDTSIVYLDSAAEMYRHMFTVDMGEHWIDRTYRHQVMFGSGDPGLEEMRMLKAVKELKYRPETINMIISQNAEEFIGKKEITWYD